ncbi:MAG: cyanophycinase [Myxococcales bacterium]|nr:cyanophycinase [Myxococcales bacterium]MCB9735226.1 cyanophycinase [Deltaproteobacteria bacterium]
MSPAKLGPDGRRGWIVPVGGAEEKISDQRILKRFAEIAGGADAVIAVIPTASELPDTGPRYQALFEELGAGEAYWLPFFDRADAENDGLVTQLERATGVFFTGGNQLRIATILGGTPVAKLVRRLSADGAIVGGTSAGAAILPEHMIAHGASGASPTAGMVQLSPGLGLTNRVVVDQHFRQRDRLGRLLTALAYNPFAIGLGLDEDTGAFIDPDAVLHVVGSGAVTVVDVSQLGHSSIADTPQGAPICMTNVRLHLLPHGATFDLHHRTATPPPG